MYEYKLALVFNNKNMDKIQAFQKNVEKLNEKLAKRNCHVNAIQVTSKNIENILIDGSIQGVTYFADQLSNENKQILETLVKENDSIDTFSTFQEDLEDKTQEKANNEQKNYIHSLNSSANHFPILSVENSNDLNNAMNVIGLATTTHANVFFKATELANQKINPLHSQVYSLLKNETEILKEKHDYTSVHVARVSSYSESIAKSMGLPTEEVKKIKITAALHDLGKIVTPEGTLSKPGKLEGKAKENMDYHSLEGLEILDFLTKIDPNGFGKTITKDIRAGILQHHDNFNKNDDLNLYAKIVAAGDCLDAMTSQRAYNNPKDILRTIEDFWSNRGRQFDPIVAEKTIMILAKSFSAKTGHTLSDFYPENSPNDNLKQFLIQHKEEINSLNIDNLPIQNFDQEGHFIFTNGYSYDKKIADKFAPDDIPYAEKRAIEANPNLDPENEFDKQKIHDLALDELNIDGRRYQAGLALANRKNFSPKEIANKILKEETRISEVVEVTKMIKENAIEKAPIKENDQSEK